MWAKGRPSLTAMASVAAMTWAQFAFSGEQQKEREQAPAPHVFKDHTKINQDNLDRVMKALKKDEIFVTAIRNDKKELDFGTKDDPFIMLSFKFVQESLENEGKELELVLELGIRLHGKDISKKDGRCVTLSGDDTKDAKVDSINVTPDELQSVLGIVKATREHEEFIISIAISNDEARDLVILSRKAEQKSPSLRKISYKDWATVGLNKKALQKLTDPEKTIDLTSFKKGTDKPTKRTILHNNIMGFGKGKDEVKVQFIQTQEDKDSSILTLVNILGANGNKVECTPISRCDLYDKKKEQKIGANLNSAYWWF